MCGFAGQFGGNLLAKELFDEILSLSKHRGPDQTGFWKDNRIQLGFNRLAIQDLSNAGAQPMLSPSGQYVVVFNGEIYNHLKIRAKLPAHRYIGRSDTETVVHALDCWGIDKTIAILEGMFALGIYDTHENVLKLARDFAGIKPLFFGQLAGDCWFASQFNQVVKGIGKEKLSLKPEGMRDFLQLGYMQAPATIYQEIEQVEPGQIVTIKNGSISRTYFQRWHPFGSQQLKTLEIDIFLESFADEINDQLLADVQVASFFSSGIDSTLVTSLAHKHLPQITAFTVGVSDATVNEADKARAYARHLGLNHVLSHITPADVLRIKDDHFRKLGEPFADYSSLPTYMVCKAGKAEATVMLSGDGGDELFWGYPRWNSYLRYYSLFKYPQTLRRVHGQLKRRLGSDMSYGPGLFKQIGDWVLNGQSHNQGVFLEQMMPGSCMTDEVKGLYSFGGASFEEFRAWLRWNEFYGHLQRVLAKVDRMSMAHSLEVRVPFLSKRIIDFAWTRKTGYGKDHFENKAFLRRALTNYLPDELIEKKKIGFSVPLESWLHKQLREETLDLLSNTRIYGESYLNKPVWRKRVDDFYLEEKGSDWGIWIMYAWQKWGELLDEI